MPSTYQQNGIELLYPDNWKVVDEQPRSDPPAVTLQSPGTGYWNLTIYPDSQEPEDLTAETVNAMRAEYDPIEVEPVECSFGKQLAGGYQMEFYCLDFIVKARTIALRTTSQTLLFVHQAEDREFKELEPIFAALVVSVLGNLRDPHEWLDPLAAETQPPL
jgi:hypothetical protein